MSDGSGLTSDQQAEPDSKQHLITIIVPTRNEVDNIRPLLGRLATAVSDLTVEVLFIDDSQDHTADHIRSVQSDFWFPVHLVARPPEERNGLSGAVVDGLRLANGEWVCVMDADLQHPPETIPRLWQKARQSGADIVVGSRRGDLAGPFGLTRMRSLTSKSLTILARMLFPRLLRNVSDPLTGLFLVKRSKIDIDALRPDGFKILLEILVRNPDLHATEIHFDFAPRNEGQSKADFREGVRFFRHVVRLRFTVNPHLIRFLTTLSLGFIGNGLLLWLISQQGGISTVLAGLIAAEALALWVVFLFDHWVFRERARESSIRSSWKRFLLVQIILLLVYVPLMFGLVSWLQIDEFLANLLSLGVIGVMLYSFSEHWVLTKRSMAWQQLTYYYDIHGILSIESQVALADLRFFAVDVPPKVINIQISIDRQGTPSQLPGGISYNEGLGRFGFGLTVLPGDLLQIIVSPLLERSPGFLFTNIVEPALRWRFVAKGFALVKAGSVTSGQSAVLICSERDLGYAMSTLCQEFDYQFMADDLTIVDKDGTVYSYPKPVTIDQNMMRNSQRRIGPSDRLLYSGQRLLYTRFARRIGLWLSDRRLPAATLNTYLQWLVPQPKGMMDDVGNGFGYGEPAKCTLIISALERVNSDAGDLSKTMPDFLQQVEVNSGFQPNPLLAKRLRFEQGKDLLYEERTIIQNLVGRSALYWSQAEGSHWPTALAQEVNEIDRGHVHSGQHDEKAYRTEKSADNQGELTSI